MAAINHGANHIDVNIIDGVFFGKIQVFLCPEELRGLEVALKKAGKRAAALTEQS